MRKWGIIAFALASACYQAPALDQPCQITCQAENGSCPDGLTCEDGYCVAEGQVCEPSFVEVSAGTDFACAIDDSRGLWCWGSNAHHVVDPGDRYTYTLATRLGSGLAWDAIDAGGDHVCGISAGQLYCWGGNSHNEAGPIGGDVIEPTQIALPNAPSAWTAVSAGHQYTCAIGDGKLYCWGLNDQGQLGTGDRTDTAIPLQVGIDADWIGVSAGEWHTCGIHQDGTVACWGLSDRGQVGPNATANPQLDPVAVGVTGTAVAVSARSTCIVATDQTLQCLGDNAGGELGEKNLGVPDTNTPLQATDVTGWTQVSAGETYFCGLTGSDVYCWGRARTGGLGHGLWDDGPNVVNPGAAFYKVVSAASAVTVGWNNEVSTNNQPGSSDLSCSLIGTKVECWGDNKYGQLGMGAATMAITPEPIAGNHAFSALSLGGSHGCGVDAGELWCWGSTQYGATTAVVYGNSGNPKKPCIATPGAERLCDLGEPKLLMLVPGADDVATGHDHTCALHNSLLTCWGDNGLNQLGTSSPAAPAARNVPAPGGVAWTTVIPTGRYGQCALPATTGTYCWGQVVTQYSTPQHETALDDFHGLALGGSSGTFTCFLDSADQLSCTGANDRGQYGDGTQNVPGGIVALGRNYTAIAAGARGDTVCGITGTDAHVECWGANSYGETTATDMGTGMLIDPTLSPVVVPGLSGCDELAAGAHFVCAMCGGTVSCWGANDVAQLGSGPPAVGPSAMPRPVDLPTATSDPWIQLVAGDSFACVRSMAGATYCWGADVHGGLGNGGISANLPTIVSARPIP